MNNVKKFFVVVFFSALLLPVAVSAATNACPGKKGGVYKCDGAKYICNDGSTGKADKPCGFNADKTTPPPARKAQADANSAHNRAVGGQNAPKKKPH